MPYHRTMLQHPCGMNRMLAGPSCASYVAVKPNRDPDCAYGKQESQHRFLPYHRTMLQHPCGMYRMLVCPSCPSCYNYTVALIHGKQE
jgi:hypothetical protein